MECLKNGKRLEELRTGREDGEERGRKKIKKANKHMMEEINAIEE